MNEYLYKFISSKFKKPGRALDLGAGDFSDVAFLKKMHWACEGVDKKTGVNLEKMYKSKTGLFDLVYSNYLIHKLKNRQQLIQTIYINLKRGGWFFIHTFDKSDRNSKSNLSKNYLRKFLKAKGFKKIRIKLFDYYDADDGHKHWHKILQATGQKWSPTAKAVVPLITPLWGEHPAPKTLARHSSTGKPVVFWCVDKFPP